MADVTSYEPYMGYRFRVSIGDAEIGFSQVDGLSSVSAVVQYREGNMPIWMRKFPGLIEWQPVTMQRGTSNSTTLLDWRNECASYEDATTTNGGVGYGDGIIPPNYRRPITISMYGKGDSNTPGKKWTLFNAWPSELKTGALNAMGNEVLIESVTIQHEGMKVESPGQNNPQGRGPGTTV
jgi:phage tail-like protein